MKGSIAVDKTIKHIVVTILSIGMVMAPIHLSACQTQGQKPFFIDGGFIETYTPPAKDETGGQDPSEIAAGAQLFENKYGSVLIPADWIIGKDRSGIDVKNLANGAVFRSGADEDAAKVSIKIYRNSMVPAEDFAQWFDGFYGAQRTYTLGPDYDFGGITYRSATFDSILGGTAFKLEYLSPGSVMVEVTIYQATPTDADVSWILERIKIKER